MRLMPVRELIFHHSASSRDRTTLEMIREWHTDPNKPGGPFADIGYHFIIEGGETAQLRYGRPVPTVGAHAPPNTGRLGCVVTGDNTIPAERWSNGQIARMWQLEDAVRLIWPEIIVRGHRDTGRRTACPGVDVSWLMGS